MKQKFPIFWLVQLGGWFCYFSLICVTNITFAPPRPNFYLITSLGTGIFILTTCLLRGVIINFGVLQKKLSGQLIFLVLSAFIVSFITTILNQVVEVFLRAPTKNIPKEPIIIIAWVSNFGIILIWNLFYFAYHYVVKSNKEILDKARLESVVKELELKTIKAHINPHFIFNALNSIRYLVDENPSQARFAITELSKLLRSSMHAESISTTRLASEIEIVQSYLELEKIRFEERLMVTWEIQHRANDFQVPPMMLQTLVENSIKHGISHQMEGGTIDIKAKVSGHYLIISIENTGKLLKAKNKDSFGIISTKNRLQLLYGSEAGFSIEQTDHYTVLVRIRIPQLTDAPID